MMMRILVSNDDGINALGLNTLVKHLATVHDVYVVAPAREQSAMGHALTLHHPLRLDEVPLEAPVKVAYAVSGTPSDCVKLALTTLLPTSIDVVISGINHGPNLGGDVVYSGTVSAALEGAMAGYPALAVSLFNGHDKHADFNPSAHFITQHLEQLLALPVPQYSVLNVNTPAVPLADFVGIQLCRLGKRMYDDYYEKRQDPRGVTYYWLAGEITARGENADVDVEAIRSNYVTVTPLHADITDEVTYERLKQSIGQGLLNA
jgi:5'-nucleotidase